jgi:hypothetical protein
MGFWDVAKNVGTVVANSIEEKANEVRETTEKYNELDDDELIRIVKSDGFFSKSQTEKTIAFKLLKERGYTPEDIKKT